MARGGPFILFPNAPPLIRFFVTISIILANCRPLKLWLGLPATNRRRLWILFLSLLAVLALFHTIRGSTGLFRGGSDLKERYDEWRLFRQGIYPATGLADVKDRLLPYFRTTVYLPWALPMFGGLFILGGIWQGKLLILIASIMGLAWIATIGWHCLRPWGREAGWLGALAPLAIMGNSLAISIGQFSIICMGLLSLQWVLLRRERQLSVALCWTIAMIKPQIALFYALPLLRIPRLPLLALGSGVLLGLSALALVHTGTSPTALAASWFGTLRFFIYDYNNNILAGLLPLLSYTPLPLLLISITAASLIIISLANRLVRRAEESPGSDHLDLAGVCAIVGYVSFYHIVYDKIMLYPALLACLRISLRKPHFWNILLSALMAATVWLPERVLQAFPDSRSLLVVIWSIVGLVLVRQIARSGRRILPEAA